MKPMTNFFRRHWEVSLMVLVFGPLFVLFGYVFLTQTKLTEYEAELAQGNFVTTQVVFEG
jgi:hypothetical protein